MSYDPEYQRAYRIKNAEKIREHKRREYLANKETVKARSREWSLKNRSRKLSTGKVYREKKLEVRRAYMRERYHKDPQKYISAMSIWRRENPERYRDQHLRLSFGISLDDYNRILAEQGGGCAICGSSPKTCLSVDHNHKTGMVRGLLCSTCNSGLGHFKDDPTRLRNAAKYIEGRIN